jgi:hypothetical protein
MFDNFFNLNHPDFIEILTRFIINIIFLFILIRVIYFRYQKKEKLLFTLFLLGIMVFFIVSVLKTASYIEIGLGMGLFAVFAILRFRTSTFTTKDMTYVFTTIGLSVINALKFVAFPFLGVIIFNIMIIISVILLEEFLLRHNYESYSIIYENLELLNSDKKQKLLKDVSEITGKNILKVKVRRVNYKRKTALLDIYYKI